MSAFVLRMLDVIEDFTHFFAYVKVTSKLEERKMRIIMKAPNKLRHARTPWLTSQSAKLSNEREMIFRLANQSIVIAFDFSFNANIYSFAIDGKRKCFLLLCDRLYLRLALRNGSNRWIFFFYVHRRRRPKSELVKIILFHHKWK